MSFYEDGQSQNGAFEDSEEGQYFTSDRKPDPVDNEYYNFLHVSRQASDEEIISAYKKFSRLYHPDKHRYEEDKKKAEIMFAKLKNAYEVLSDPHKRAIYDCLGKKGLEEQGWQIVKRTKTPQEIREEYEQLAKEREERQLQIRTNPTTKMQVTVNATDLFERYLYNEELDDVLDTSLPSLEVTEVTLGQTIEVPISNTQKVILAGNVGTQNGTGNGSVNFTFRRIPSMRCWQDLDVGFGNGPSIGGKFNYIFTNAAFANTSGTLQITPRGLQPSYSFSFGNRLGKQTMGYLSFTSNFLTKVVDNGISITPNASGMSSSIVHDTPNYHIFGSLQLGIPSTFMSFSVTRKFNEGETKVKGALKFGTFGGLIEYGIERKVTKHSAVSAFMVVGLPTGVTLRLRLVRSSQSYTFPIHLSDEIMLQPVFYGTITPLIVWFTLKKLVFDPIEEKKQEEERKRQSEANLQKLIEARKDALSSISLMRARYNRIVTNEASQNGLIILIGLYGRLLSDNQELLVNLDSGPVSLNCEDSGEIDDLNFKFPFLHLESLADVIDVTIPVQCLVEDGGKLVLYDGGSKTDLAGFYDPCAPTTKEMIKKYESGSSVKHLLIRYLFQNQLHQVIIEDNEGVQIPKTTHRIERT